MCGCARSKWKDCEHPWHFNFSWDKQISRFSLDRQVGRRLRTKEEARKVADDLRSKIRDGKFGLRVPDRETLTLGDLLDDYERRKLSIRPGGTTYSDQRQIAVIKRTELVTVKGERRAFAQWLVADVMAGALLQYREVRQVKMDPIGTRGPRLGGPIAVNRNFALLRAEFNWAIVAGIVEQSPFKRATVTTVKLTKETRRTRRLHGDERNGCCQPAMPISAQSLRRRSQPAAG